MKTQMPHLMKIMELHDGHMAEGRYMGTSQLHLIEELPEVEELLVAEQAHVVEELQEDSMVEGHHKHQDPIH